ncbi:PilN domain-containing protein [Rhodoferax sp.]|uniref:PilN domain-containing protein n=1 Tax=Rhodoferax sp. TaxID=50421 RepID=UPI0025E376AB|nr:PilN domain-containing protein [Rhodoferax sp.]
MILINLLPHREAARARRRETFQVMLVVSVLLGALLIGIGFLWCEAQISGQQERNVILTQAVTVLDGQIKEIANIESEIKALTERQKAVEDLQADRNLPVHLLNELVKQLPDGTYITSLKQENQSVSIQGVAQSNERVSEMLRNLANNTPWLSKPDLVEIVASTVTLTPRDQRRVAKFNLRVRLMRSSEVQKTVESAASAAVVSP